ncbi:MAG: CAP domain-containing protein [Brumimicrobium sp.]|nr:CAP domain-containing protein [Brumimicrobium sp.]
MPTFVLSILISYLLMIQVNAQSQKDQSWSAKKKAEFYSAYQYDSKSQNEQKVIDLMFKQVQLDYKSLTLAQKDMKYLPKLEEICSLKVFVPITGQLTREQEAIIHQEMVRLINEFRKENGNKPLLNIDSDLDMAAKLQSDYCASMNRLSHIQNNDREYGSVTKRISMIKNGHYKKAYTCGENATYTFIDMKKIDEAYLKKIAFDLFTSWVESKGHRENMLNRDFKYFGFALTIRADVGYIYAIQVFNATR